MTNSPQSCSAATEDDSMRRIILALFNPMPDGHEKGCLANDPHIRPRGPCICKYGEAAGEYLWALREAKKIASEHYGQKEVEESRRLEEPVGLVEAAALVATDAQACAVRLEARPADNSKEWTEIFPAQLEWVAKAGHQVRAIEVAAQPPAAPVETATRSAPQQTATQNNAERVPSSDAALCGAGTQYSPGISMADWERVFQDACDEAGCAYDNEALLSAIAALRLAAQPPAAPVGMTYNTIKAAFDEYHKTLTVMDKPASFDSFSQGYVAGWNAKEAQAHEHSSAETAQLTREDVAEHLYERFAVPPAYPWSDKSEDGKNLWRRYADEILALIPAAPQGAKESERSAALEPFIKKMDWPLGGLPDTDVIQCRVVTPNFTTGGDQKASFGLTVADFRKLREAFQPSGTLKERTQWVADILDDASSPLTRPHRVSESAPDASIPVQRLPE